MNDACKSKASLCSPRQRTMEFRARTNLPVEVQLLHVLVRVPNSDEGTKLCPLLTLSVLQELLPFPPPAVPIQVDAGGRAEKSLLVPVRLLCYLRMLNHQNHVPPVPEVSLHGLSR